MDSQDSKAPQPVESPVSPLEADPRDQATQQLKASMQAQRAARLTQGVLEKCVALGTSIFEPGRQTAS